jgi:hypothetical protein
MLTGISIFWYEKTIATELRSMTDSSSLTKRDSMLFTRLFGGTNGNEGLGFLSLCLDWNYVTVCAWIDY